MHISPWMRFGLFALFAVVVSSCSSSTGDDPVDVTPPPVPTGLAIASIGNGAVNLDWNAVSDKGLSGYNVYWSANQPATAATAQVRFVTTNSASITSLDYDTRYYFAVSSVDKSGNESALSVQTNGIPSNTLGPASPTNVDIVAENAEMPQITVFWLENVEPDIDHYNIYRAETTEALQDTTSLLITETETVYIDSDVIVGTTYYYRVTAVDEGGWESAPSAIVSDYVLPPVSLVSPVSFGFVGAHPQLSWNPVTGATKYAVSIYANKQGNPIWNIEVDKLTTQVTYNGSTVLIGGEKYYWKVGAVSRTEINSTSPWGSFTVLVE